LGVSVGQNSPPCLALSGGRGFPRAAPASSLIALPLLLGAGGCQLPLMIGSRLVSQARFHRVRPQRRAANLAICR
jgi:hypothetical protein